MRYVVWVKVDGKWDDNGEGEMTKKQADRIAGELRRSGYRSVSLPAGVQPKGKEFE